MASTEPSTAHAVRRLASLTPGTLAMLGDLVAASHWNQTAEDWALFHAQGEILAVHDAAGRIVASGAVLPMGGPGQVAWISMILVLPELRGQGLGRAVFDQCLRRVQADGRVAMLDATPAGEALYRQFGFVPLWRLTRWHREPHAATGASLRHDPDAFDALAALDRQALGFERAPVLDAIGRRASTLCVHTGTALALVRTGRSARQLGPVLAPDEPAAAAALAHLAGGLADAILVDVPDERPLLRTALEAAGFRPQRGFARMALAPGGRPPPAGDAAVLHAIAGPEFA